MIEKKFRSLQNYLRSINYSILSAFEKGENFVDNAIPRIPSKPERRAETSQVAQFDEGGPGKVPEG